MEKKGIAVDVLQVRVRVVHVSVCKWQMRMSATLLKVYGSAWIVLILEQINPAMNTHVRVENAFQSSRR